MADYVGKERCGCGAWASQTLHYRIPNTKQNIYGARKTVEACEVCATRASLGNHTPYKVEPLGEWTAWLGKERRRELGVAKRKLHREQMAFDV